MDLSRPLRVVTPTLDGDVLQVLAQADAAFTSGDIARLAEGPSPAGIRRTLGRLVHEGIVSRQQAGRVYLYRLNRDHLAADAVMALADQRGELLRRLGTQARNSADPPLFAAIFGSAARRDHSERSDLDLFLVRPNGADTDAWEAACDELASRATAWTGNDARIVSLTESEVLRPGGHVALLESIAREGLVFSGEPGWLRHRLIGPRHGGWA